MATLNRDHLAKIIAKLRATYSLFLNQIALALIVEGIVFVHFKRYFWWVVHWDVYQFTLNQS